MNKWIQKLDINFLCSLLDKYSENEKGIYYIDNNLYTGQVVEKYKCETKGFDNVYELTLVNDVGNIVIKIKEGEYIFEYDDGCLSIYINNNLIFSIFDVNYNEIYDYCCKNDFNQVNLPKNDGCINGLGFFSAIERYQFPIKPKNIKIRSGLCHISKSYILEFIREMVMKNNSYIEIKDSNVLIELIGLEVSGKQYVWECKFENDKNILEIQEYDGSKIEVITYYVEVPQEDGVEKLLTIKVGESLRIHLENSSIEDYKKIINYEKECEIRWAELREMERSYFDSLSDIEVEALDNLYEK